MPIVDPPPPIAPISFPTTPIATAVRLGQPAAIGAIYYLNFGRIVTDPTDSLAKLLAVVTAAQFVYLVGAVPEVSDKYRGKRRPGEKMKGTSLGRDLFTAVLSLFLSLLVTPFVYLVIVLFGGPFLTHVFPTLLCAAHFTVLAVYPLVFAHGVEGRPWQAIGSLGQPFDELYGALLGGMLGAWLGAVPIPLDWDREWQKWPVTIVTGIYLGVAAGRLLGGTVLFGKRIVELDFDEKKQN